MAPLYFVLAKQVTGENWKFVIKMNADHPVYEGHFPERAIVPGAVLVQVIRELAESALNRKLELKEAGSIKFLKMIFPAADSELEIILVRAGEEDVKVNSEIKIKSVTYFKMSAVYA